MDKSYFIYTSQEDNVVIKRFHICTWEFSDDSTLVEFGAEITANSIENKNSLELILFVPWLNTNAKVEDFYSKLKEASNSRFIFNDSILSTDSLDGGQNLNGVIHKFSERSKLCILPVTFISDFAHQKITVRIDLNLYNHFAPEDNNQIPNIYFRFCITPNGSHISETKKGITKSTILYDIRLNQRRNIPEYLLNEILQSNLCNVNSCFCFNIIPNTHDLSFFDSSTLKNVRTLEYDSFNKYLGEKDLKEKDLIVVFNKASGLDAYAFFSIYSKEHIGIEQLTLALLINLVAGLLLFVASIDASYLHDKKKFSISDLPNLFWWVVALFILLLLYLIKRRFKIPMIKIRKRK